jgi:dipeptidyl aminopeptidase/acylaminoacyl peptidase
MSGSPPARRAPAPRRPASGGFALSPRGSWIAPWLSLMGLLVVALVTLGLMNGRFPTPAGSSNGQRLPGQTPTPSNVIIPNPRADVPGSIVYVKAGNIWIQSGKTVKQLTNKGTDSMPSWSPDGQWIYFIDTEQDREVFALRGEKPTRYTLTYPILSRIHPDGSGRQAVKSGLFKKSAGTWFYWIREPVMSPDGKTLAVLSDAPDPTNSDVVLQLFDLKTRTFKKLALPENSPLGHQDPAWSPDGTQLLYVKNARDGTRGAPQINRYDIRTKRVTTLTGPGYTGPAWSPDGRYIAATKMTALDNDIVILDARNGNELLRLTNDGRSWSAVWSPKGDGIAFLHIVGAVVDLVYAPLKGDAPRWSIDTPFNLTDLGGLDPASHPSWFLPPDQRPNFSPSAVPASPSPSQ